MAAPHAIPTNSACEVVNLILRVRVSIATTIPGISMLLYILSSGTSTSIEDPKIISNQYIILYLLHMKSRFTAEEGE